MQPKGSTPPMMMPGMGRVYRDWSGIWRGIWFVRTGCSMGWQQHSTYIIIIMSPSITGSASLPYYHLDCITITITWIASSSLNHLVSSSITLSPGQHHHHSISWTASPLYHLVSIIITHLVSIIITWTGSSSAYYLDCTNTLAEQHQDFTSHNGYDQESITTTYFPLMEMDQLLLPSLILTTTASTGCAQVNHHHRGVWAANHSHGPDNHKVAIPSSSFFGGCCSQK